MRLNHRLLLAVTALFASATLAQASIHTFDAYFDGLQESPPNASPATGFASASLDDSSGAFTIISGSYSSLIGTSVAVTLNNAPPGTAGPVLFSLTNDTPGTTTGTFSGGGVLTAPQISAMIAGNTYVNIRSTVFPAGEIRGQLIETPEPATWVLAVLSGLGVLVARWRRLVG